jgi:hypothetical protein
MLLHLLCLLYAYDNKKGIGNADKKIIRKICNKMEDFRKMKRMDIKEEDHKSL